MAIVSSTYIVGTPQKDGRSYVKETHITDLGERFYREYGPIGVVDYQAIANAQGSNLESELSDSEAERIFNDYSTTPVIKYQTNAQFLIKLRNRFRESSRDETAKLSFLILKLISDGIFTDTQIRIAFSMTALEYTTFKAKITLLRDKWLDINNARGE